MVPGFALNYLYRLCPCRGLDEVRGHPPGGIFQAQWPVMTIWLKAAQLFIHCQVKQYLMLFYIYVYKIILNKAQYYFFWEITFVGVSNHKDNIDA